MDNMEGCYAEDWKIEHDRERLRIHRNMMEEAFDKAVKAENISTTIRSEFMPRWREIADSHLCDAIAHEEICRQITAAKA